MNINERLTARTENGMAYLKNVKNDEQEVEGSCNTLKCIKESWDKLAYLEDLQEKGRLHITPCNIGGKMYWYDANYDGQPHVGDFPVREILITKDGVFVSEETHDSYFDKIGTKYAMLTKSDAEKALKESEDKNNAQ